ncbi:uncharacterized protein METZ01_LOCUS185722, partial [marine metagenome]
MTPAPSIIPHSDALLGHSITRLVLVAVLSTAKGDPAAFLVRQVVYMQA